MVPGLCGCPRTTGEFARLGPTETTRSDGKPELDNGLNLSLGSTKSAQFPHTAETTPAHIVDTFNGHRFLNVGGVMLRWSCLLVLLAARSLCAQPSADAVALSRRIEYWNPAWSPDGRTLVFESNLEGKYTLFLINSDGTGLRRLTTDSAENTQPNWSPDGRRIVFSSNRSGTTELYTMNADGSGATRLTTMGGGAWYQSSFSPDGKWVAFQGRSDNAETRDRVFVIGVDGTGLRLLSDSTLGAEGPRWAPDGRTVQFLSVPYPKRLWREMGPDDMQAAKAGQRMVSVRPDASGLAPLPQARAGESETTWSRDGSSGYFTATREGATAVFQLRRGQSSAQRIVSTDVVPSGFEPSPNGGVLAYSKSDGGYAGLYAFDVTTRAERLLTGGPGVGPIGYLRTARLTAASDTFDTYTSPKAGGERTSGGTSFARTVRQTGAARFEIADHWLDSSGRVTARQTVRTGDGTLATQIETVRADRDSAALLVSPQRVTAWVVPEGQPARLFDGPAAGERYGGTVVISAIAKARPAIGSLFLAPVAALYGANPLLPVIDSIRVVARDTVTRGGAAIPVLVIERTSGTRFWVEESSGSQVAARGNAGPQRWWWHIRRGIRLNDR
jgi:WD40 repeat protein